VGAKHECVKRAIETADKKKVGGVSSNEGDGKITSHAAGFRKEVRTLSGVNQEEVENIGGGKT